MMINDELLINDDIYYDEWRWIMMIKDDGLWQMMTNAIRIRMQVSTTPVCQTSAAAASILSTAVDIIA